MECCTNEQDEDVSMDLTDEITDAIRGELTVTNCNQNRSKIVEYWKKEVQERRNNDPNNCTSAECEIKLLDNLESRQEVQIRHRDWVPRQYDETTPDEQVELMNMIQYKINEIDESIFHNFHMNKLRPQQNAPVLDLRENGSLPDNHQKSLPMFGTLTMK
jgi:hypothetical protein